MANEINDDTFNTEVQQVFAGLKIFNVRRKRLVGHSSVVNVKVPAIKFSLDEEAPVYLEVGAYTSSAKLQFEVSQV